MNQLAEQCAIVHEFFRLSSHDCIQLEKLYFSLVDTLSVCLEQSHLWLIDPQERARAFELIHQLETINYQSRLLVLPTLLETSVVFTNELKQSIAQYEFHHQQQSLVIQETFLQDLRAMLKEMQHVLINSMVANRFHILIDYYLCVLSNHDKDLENIFSSFFPSMKIAFATFHRKFQEIDNSKEQQQMLLLITKVYNHICQFNKRNHLSSNEIPITKRDKGVRMDILYEILTKIVRMIDRLKFQESKQPIIRRSVSEQRILDLIANVLRMMASSEHRTIIRSARISYSRTIKAFITLLKIEHSNSDMTFDRIYDFNLFIRHVLIHLNMIFECLLLPDDTELNGRLLLYKTKLDHLEQNHQQVIAMQTSANLPPLQQLIQTKMVPDEEPETIQEMSFSFPSNAPHALSLRLSSPSSEPEQTLYNTDTDDESCALLQATACVTGMDILKKYGLIST